MENGRGARVIRWIAVGGIVSILLLATACLAAKGKEEGGETPADSPVAENVTGREDRFTILLCGSDDAAALSDVMMLVSLDPTAGEAWVMQIPRDTYARFSEKGYRKLNGAASALGGMDGLCDFFEEAFGVRIDRYVRLSLSGFRRVVDALGGVEITLPEALDYDDPAQGLSIHLPGGTQRLDGRTAEHFVRYRSGYTRGDLDRLDAQKLFLSALLETVRKTHSPVTLCRVAASLLGELETNLTLGDVMTLVPQALAIEREGIFFVTAPGEDLRSEKSGASFYVLSKKGMETLLCDHFGGKEGCFDPEKSFLNQNDGDFSRIYEKEISYSVVCAAEKK